MYIYILFIYILYIGYRESGYAGLIEVLSDLLEEPRQEILLELTRLIAQESSSLDPMSTKCRALMLMSARATVLNQGSVPLESQCR